MPSTLEAFTGCILGAAVGDALGLPFEGISKRRLDRMAPDLDRYHFLFGKGMVSDDTEHICLVAQSIIESGDDPDLFEKGLARRLRWWLACVPAGVGFATLRAILKLWLGFGPKRSGVWSAGNGPAMRSAIIGVVFRNDPNLMREFVLRSTRLTHTDPRAFQGALAIALAAAAAVENANEEIDAGAFVERFKRLTPDENAAEFYNALDRVAASAARGEDTERFAESMGLGRGVTGYVLHTVPVALHAWLSSLGDFERAIVRAVRCGGDTDTVAAIVGGVAGAGVGESGIPTQRLDSLCEWPRSVSWMRRLACRLHEVRAETPPRPRRERGPFMPFLLKRNLLFLVVVLAHGFRRLAPPY